MNALTQGPSWNPRKGQDNDDSGIEFSRISGFIRRRYRLAIIGGVLAALLAGVMLHFTTPSYQSTVRIVLAEDRTKLLEEISGVETAKNADEYIATQIGLIESQSVAQRVANSLDLSHNAIFMANRPSLMARARALFPTLPFWASIESGEGPAPDLQSEAVNRLRNSLLVFRLERSLIIEMSYTSSDAELARDIASAYGDAYLADQTESHFSAVNRASVWLEGRIEDLRQQSLTASQEVEAFRAKNDLVAANGQLVAEQNLLGMNSQMVLAEATYARQKARLQVYEDVLKTGSVDDVIGVLTTTPDLQQTAAIQSLRSEYLQASERENAITARWGRDNEQAVAVRAEKDRLSRLLLDEARRTVASYRNDLEIGQSQLKDMSSTIQSASGRTQNANSTLVTLRSLEQRAESYHALYQSYLTRYQEAVQQQSLAINSARVISQAQLPIEPILPKKKIVLALCAVLGIVAGAGVGVVREMQDRGFRSYREVDELRLDFLGYLPRFGRRARKAASRRSGAARGGLYSASMADIDDRVIEVLRNVKTASDLAEPKRGRIVGVVSLLPGEGKSHVALSLAHLMASSGQSVLLIDGNTQNPALSAALAPEHEAGFSPILDRGKTLDEVAVSLPSGVTLLPSPRQDASAAPRAVTVMPLVQQCLSEWRTRFDVTIVELPPIAATSDVRAVAEDLDQILFVISWGDTDRTRFEHMLHSNPGLRAKSIGALLTHVDLDTIRRYDPFYREIGISGGRRARRKPAKIQPAKIRSVS